MEFSITQVRSKVLDCIRDGMTQEEQDVTQLAEVCDASQYSNQTIDGDIKQIVDTSLREVLQELTREPSLLIEEYKNLLTFCIASSRQEISSRNLPVLLLSDIFDCRTLAECEQLFSLVEEFIDVWKDDDFFKHVKNQLLRSCNDLLRRLSRSQNNVFCGRILVFLAKFFPLFERSGLNLISEFNQDNVTAFSVQDDGSLVEPMVVSDKDLEEGETKDADTDSLQVDYNFYRKFWQLQEYFRTPVSCFNKTKWKQLQTYSSFVLSTFESYKLDPASCTNFQGLGIDDSNEEYLYFAKYLTNQKLLELQLSDSNFRRYILVQFLILFQYLKSNVKFKQETHVLNEEQSNWVKECTEKIFSLLDEIPPNGVEFRKCIEKILQREEYWSNWKNDGCPELKEVNEACNIRATYARKRKLVDELKAAEGQSMVLIGKPELNHIWNLCPDNWEACRSKKRVFVPTIEKYFEESLKANANDRQKKCSDSEFSWKALRLFSLKSPYFFTPSNQMVKSVNSYLEGMLEKVSKEFGTATLKNTNDITIDDAEDISDDELLKNADVSADATSPTPDGES